MIKDFALFILQLNAYLVKKFYPKRPSGQGIFTGVFPSPPRCMPSLLSRTGFSIPTLLPAAYARRFSSKFRQLMLSRFPPVNCLRKSQTSTSTHSGRLEPITSTTVERRNLPTTHIVEPIRQGMGFAAGPPPPSQNESLYEVTTRDFHITTLGPGTM